MDKSLIIICPVCDQSNTKKILELTTGNFNQSTLYSDIRIYVCLNCGHIFNCLSEDELIGLANYYREEKTLANANSQDKVGDIPGSNNPQTIDRYQKLFDFVKKYLLPDANILDIGFSKGGFTRFLKEHGYQAFIDIDVVDEYLGQARSIDSIPSADNSIDFLVMDQVMEHLIKPDEAFKEAARVLKPGGILCLGVPDADRYDKNYFFDFYWFLLREHIQHFDLVHLNSLAKQANFELVDQLASDAVMMNENMLLPNLNLIFKLKIQETNSASLENNFTLMKKVENYITCDLLKLETRRELIDKLIKKQTPLYIWGMSREFFYLYEEAGLKHCHIKGLIDTNPYKQQNLTVEGRNVQSPEVLKDAKVGDNLLITATAHNKAIEARVQEINSQIDCLILDK